MCVFNHSSLSLVAAQTQLKGEVHLVITIYL